MRRAHRTKTDCCAARHAVRSRSAASVARPRRSCHSAAEHGSFTNAWSHMRRAWSVLPTPSATATRLSTRWGWGGDARVCLLNTQPKDLKPPPPPLTACPTHARCSSSHRRPVVSTASFRITYRPTPNQPLHQNPTPPHPQPSKPTSASAGLPLHHACSAALSSRSTLQPLKSVRRLS